MVVHKGKVKITLRVNGSEHDVLVRPADLLIDTLRGLGLTSAKPGCLNGDCGACTIIMDGWPAKSCLVLAVEAEGHELLTVEGLGGNSPIQQAFVSHSAFQCGYCTSGFLMVCHALKTQFPVQPEEYVIEEWLQSNICRCTSYAELRAAVGAMYDA